MAPSVSGHFVPAGNGALAVVLWEPPAGVGPRFRALCIPPAFEEMNKSRRTIALAARALARIGGVVAIVDLTGTGDSTGDHGEATWDRWHEDALTTWHWLLQRGDGPSLLWGVRLGGLLAANLACNRRLHPDALLLWQPVTSGRAFFNQFLRLVTARQFTGAESSAETQAVRPALLSGQSVEVSGYELHPRLVLDAERCELAALPSPTCGVVWREVTAAAAPALSPAAAKISAKWQAEGVDVDAGAVVGPSFWSAQEIAEAPELVEATVRSMRARFDSPRAIAPVTQA